MQPSENLFKVARAMFQELWTHRLTQAATQKKALEAELAKIDGQVSQLLTRILDTSVPSIIGAYEEKVRKLESDKLLIKERLASAGKPVSTFDDTLRTALAFLANPCNLWNSERLEDRRAVLKLTFAERLRYKRNEGFRTANLSLPFKVLGDFLGGKEEMARHDGATSNELFEVLANWNSYLEQRQTCDPAAAPRFHQTPPKPRYARSTRLPDARP